MRVLARKKKTIICTKRRNGEMRFKNGLFFLILVLIATFIGCKENSPPEAKFIPPKNKIVIKEMAKRYAQTSVALTKAVEEEAALLEDFRKKRNISLGMEELSDREFREKHSEIIAEWDSLQEEWEKKQKSIYKKYEMDEEEWDWIAGALIMPRNRPMQDFIREEIERLKKEEVQRPKQTTDNN